MATDKQQHKEEKATFLQEALPPQTVLKSGLREYKVVEVLGAGGFGITYKVEADIRVGNVTVSSYFVIKEHFLKGCWRAEDKRSVLHAPTMETDVKMTRKDFIDEAKCLNKLGQKTPNIVKVNEVFEANGTAYYVMEYLDGGDLLHHVLQYGPLPEEDAVRLIVIVAKAVALLHEQNLLHLDIKPDNIVLKADSKTGRLLPVLIDFGIAKHFDKSGKPTSHLTAKGASEGYAPMEQYDEITHFAPEIDVYALGATLYFLLTGKHPPKAFNIHSFRGLQDNLPSGISTQTVNALAAAMKPGKYERTQTVSAFVRDLNGEHITGHDTEIFTKKEKKDVPRPPRLFPKKRLLLFVGVACAAVLLLEVGGWILRHDPLPKPSIKKEKTVIEDSVGSSTPQTTVSDVVKPIEVDKQTNGEDIPLIDSASPVGEVLVNQFYKGAFTDSDGKYPIELSFTENLHNHTLTDCIYKNVNLGGKIRMTGEVRGDDYVFTGKDGRHTFRIVFNKHTRRGSATDGPKELGVVFE